MPTTTVGPALSTLSFTDPQEQPGWRYARVPATAPAALTGTGRPLAVQVHGAGTTWDLDGWREATHTTSLLVVARGEVVHEHYAAGLGSRTLFLGASMTKSVLAHLVGRAVRDVGLDLAEPVVRTVPELSGTGYDGPTVQDVLTMCSGVDWAEDHRDPASAASRLLAAFASGGRSRTLLGEVRHGAPAGSRFAYCTADSQVLDWVRERVTGRSYVEDLTRLWADLGCTDDAVVATDGEGVALAGGALAATTRDWAKVALLAATGETDRGERLLDAGWVDAAARPAHPFLGVGRLPSTLSGHVGFGYHWWPLADDGRRVAADGSRGQLAAVDRPTGTAVVKTSRWPFDDAWVDRQHRDLSYLGLHALLDLAAADPTTERTRP